MARIWGQPWSEVGIQGMKQGQKHGCMMLFFVGKQGKMEKQEWDFTKLERTWNGKDKE